jgi:hypothetical protein
LSNIPLAIRYWARATVHPGAAIRALQHHPSKVAVAFWINLIFAALYTVTVVIYTLIGRLPAFTPWIPIAAERYYFYQAFWTIPWGLATWIMMAGICHLLAIAGHRQRVGYHFEDALVVCGLAWIVPNLICMWIPETLLVPLGVAWPAWVEIPRLMVIPPLWQVGLVAIGLRITHEIGWLWAALIGLLSVVIFFVMFLAFMR